MDLGLKGKKAILVGANGGIGRVVAKTLAGEGCAVAICGRSQGKVDIVASELAAAGVPHYTEALDVTDAEAVPAFVEKAAGELGGCDIFISFTSINPGEDTDAAWETVLKTDILPMRRGIAAAKPYLIASDDGSIVCMSSTGAVEEFMGVQPYNALKAAVINYSAALSQSLAAEGIRANCITPGPVWTDDGPWPQIKEAAPEFFDSIVAQIPAGRMTTGEELAKAIVFTASPACKAMTGTNIVIDGAFTKRVQF
ncbi:SDR family NAD(P)-dependent oxidoreductase [Novosphingobium album (ex Hu et al. 2023)]|uniref:SDR family oxidoreductase n=1 Tax=Novosphingobium album (ex Hu et al. 2023) TaxID=2930093 RepID=A0ABT0B1K5_9SPHN|nr:SDR family oxidoreductase [Novosphingobium album (ex Hu et al. 2023)]MCJ2178758.1 SDR family oxidoreductase [Novosphingobium album (ex Hu et al. 2023)]